MTGLDYLQSDSKSKIDIRFGNRDRGVGDINNVTEPNTTVAWSGDDWWYSGEWLPDDLESFLQYCEEYSRAFRHFLKNP